MADDWSAYRRLERILAHMNYRHLIINHSQNFVDSRSGAHTQTVEGVNSVIKRCIRKAGTNLGDIRSIIDLVLVKRWKVFKRRNLWQYIIEGIVEYTRYL